MKLGIVVGHTSRSPGAYSPTLAVSEYDWNTDLADLMLEMSRSLPPLEAKIFFRDGGGVPKAYRDAEMWGAEATVELHFNSFGDPAANGTETLYAMGSERGEAIASQVQAGMVRMLGLKDRGLVATRHGDRGSASLTAIAAPAVLVEPFFGSNANDCAVAAANKEGLAAGIVQAFWRHWETMI